MGEETKGSEQQGGVILGIENRFANERCSNSTEWSGENEQKEEEECAVEKKVGRADAWSNLPTWKPDRPTPDPLTLLLPPRITRLSRPGSISSLPRLIPLDAKVIALSTLHSLIRTSWLPSWIARTRTPNSTKQTIYPITLKPILEMCLLETLRFPLQSQPATRELPPQATQIDPKRSSPLTY